MALPNDEEWKLFQAQIKAYERDVRLAAERLLSSRDEELIRKIEGMKEDLNDYSLGSFRETFSRGYNQAIKQVIHLIKN